MCTRCSIRRAAHIGGATVRSASSSTSIDAVNGAAADTGTGTGGGAPPPERSPAPHTAAPPPPPPPPPPVAPPPAPPSCPLQLRRLRPRILLLLLRLAVVFDVPGALRRRLRRRRRSFAGVARRVARRLARRGVVGGIGIAVVVVVAGRTSPACATTTTLLGPAVRGAKVLRAVQDVGRLLALFGFGCRASIVPTTRSTARRNRPRPCCAVTATSAHPMSQQVCAPVFCSSTSFGGSSQSWIVTIQPSRPSTPREPPSGIIRGEVRTCQTVRHTELHERAQRPCAPRDCDSS